MNIKKDPFIKRSFLLYSNKKFVSKIFEALLIIYSGLINTDTNIGNVAILIISTKVDINKKNPKMIKFIFSLKDIK